MTCNAQKADKPVAVWFAELNGLGALLVKAAEAHIFRENQFPIPKDIG